MRKFYNLLKITYHIIGKHKDVFECYSDDKKSIEDVGGVLCKDFIMLVKITKAY